MASARREVSEGGTAYDEVTIEACRRGERDALDVVLRAEAPGVERLVARLIGPGADVADVLQQCLSAAVVAFGSYRGEASVRTWLARIAVRTAYHHLRRPERRRRAPLELVRSAAQAPSGARSQEEELATREILARVARHLDALRPKMRLAFALHVLEGRSIDEAAALMGATRAATKTRVFMARRTLVGRLRRDPALADWLRAEEACP
ncbi:MAG: sigma-70 family RNA polymerase sigma factor [Myxococcales bacterium]|nr:sigma-70 family RNA polymerase sigma factor [Myxococcales bacterium]